MSARETDVYVPWQDGAAELDVKKGMFYHLVTTHGIRKQGGGRNVRYSWRDIQRVKQDRETQKGKRQAYRPRQKPTILDWLTPNDIPALLAFNRDVYGPDLPLNEMAVYQERYKRNGKIAIAALSPDRSICYGCIGLLPLPEQICLDVLSGKRDEVNISNDELETYDRPGGYTLLCTSVAIRPDRRDLVARMLLKWVDWWVDQFPEKWIARIYAQTWSDGGERTVQQFFMSPLAGYPTDAYYLDMARASRSKVIASYHERIRERYQIDQLPDIMLERYTPPLPE